MLLILAFILLIFENPGDKIQINDAWMRPAAKGMNSALYFKIANNSDKPDTLYKVSFQDANFCEMHETYEKGKDMMGMREVNNVIVKSHSTFEFKPMSHHVMLIDLKKDVPAGDTASAVLYFKNAGRISISISVKDK